MDSSIKRMKQTFAELQSWCVKLFSSVVTVARVEAQGALSCLESEGITKQPARAFPLQHFSLGMKILLRNSD